MPSSGGDKEVGEIGGLSEGGGHLKGSWQYGLERGEYLNFFCKNTVRLRNLRDYSQNLRTKQPPRINSELPGTVRTEQI
jgi:hypothetical protein